MSERIYEADGYRIKLKMKDHEPIVVITTPEAESISLPWDVFLDLTKTASGWTKIRTIDGRICEVTAIE